MLLVMSKPRSSALVDLVMADATPEERAEATRHWFGFLLTLLWIVEEQDRAAPDSRESEGGDRFGA